MTSIFINYRRDDTSGYAGRIEDRLASAFGADAVFRDLDDIRPGVNFVRAIEDGVIGCDVMLVLIGKRWLDVRDSSGRRRIDNPEDFVRREIAEALESNIRVLPVLVNDASMPAENELPEALARLASIQAIPLSDERWDYDLGQLLASIGGAKARIRGSRRRWIGIAALIVLLASAALALMWWKSSRAPDIAGLWVADVQYGFGVRHTEKFAFRIDAGTLGGVASFLGVDRGILEGKMTSNQLSFVTRTEEVSGDEKRQTEHHYRGIVSGNEIRFVMQTEGGFSPHPPVEWTARRMPVHRPE